MLGFLGSFSKRRLAFALGFTGAALLALWLALVAEHERRAPEQVAPLEGRLARSAAGSPELVGGGGHRAGPSFEAGASGSDPTPQAPRRVRVRVTSEGEPVQAATVLIARDNPAATSLGVVLEQDSVALGTSDEQGLATLEIPQTLQSGAASLVVVAAAPNLQRGTALLAGQVEDVTVELAAGLLVEGSVEPAPGGSTSGLDLELVPWASVGLDDVRSTVHASFHHRTRVEDSGRFAFSGLAPGRFALRSVTPGTRLRSQTGQVARFGLPVQAGSRSVRVGLEHLRLVRLRAMDSATSRPMTFPHGTSNVLFRVKGERQSSIQRETYWVWTGTSWRSGPEDPDDPSVLVGLVAATDERAFVDGVDAFLEPEGYLSVETRLRAVHPSALATDASVDEVRFRPEDPDERPMLCEFVVQEPPCFPGTRRGMSRYALFTSEDGVRIARRGARQGDGTWQFRGYPEGKGLVVVSDEGLNRAAGIHVALSPSRVERLTAVYGGMATFAVQVVDGRGREIAGLSVGLHPAGNGGRGEGLVDEMSRPRLSDSGREVSRLCMMVPPGAYRFSAHAPEVGMGGIEVELGAESFTLVRVVLDQPMGPGPPGVR